MGARDCLCGKLQLQLLLWVQLAGLAPYFFLACRASGRAPHGHVSWLHIPGMYVSALSWCSNGGERGGGRGCVQRTEEVDGGTW